MRHMPPHSSSLYDKDPHNGIEIRNEYPYCFYLLLDSLLFKTSNACLFSLSDDRPIPYNGKFQYIRCIFQSRSMHNLITSSIFCSREWQSSTAASVPAYFPDQFQALEWQNRSCLFIHLFRQEMLGRQYT